VSCGAPSAASAAAIDVSGQTVIEGTVKHASEPLGGAYVRLLDRSGEFTAEVPTGETGRFRFFAVPGEWTLRALVPRTAAVDAVVVAAAGEVTEIDIDV
jgi:Protein of unknown function (DUF1416)